MSNIKISQLSFFPGPIGASGSFIVMNDSGSNATYKIEKERWVFPYNGDATITGRLFLSGSNHNITGSLRVTGSAAITGSLDVTSSFIRPLDIKGAGGSRVFATMSTGSTIFSLYNTGSNPTFFAMGNDSGSFQMDLTTTVSEKKLTMQGTVDKISIDKNTEITGSLNVSGSALTVSGSFLQRLKPANFFNNINLRNTDTGSATNLIVSQRDFTGSVTITSTDGILLPNANVNLLSTGPNQNETISLLSRPSSGGALTGFELRHVSGSLRLDDYTSTVAPPSRNNILLIPDTVSGSTPSVQFKRNIEVTGSVNLTNKLNLAAQNPLPAGVLGDLAVSSSNALYFHNGTSWNLIS